MFKASHLIIRKGLMGLIHVYRNTLSLWLPSSCRYYPSCSSYALHALKRRNVFQAIGLIIWRLLRCNPFFRGGYDPIR